MAEYIEREAAVHLLMTRGRYLTKDLVMDAAYEVSKIHAADVAPVVHGEWLKTQEPLGWHDVDCVECSACHESWIVDEDYGYDFLDFWHYCPNCGARMDGA